MSVSDVLKQIKEEDIKYVDFRFTDTRGKEQHVTAPTSFIDEDTFTEGKMFDGSSVAGWKGINESDMILMPEAETAVLDPFFQELIGSVGGAARDRKCDLLISHASPQNYDDLSRLLELNQSEGVIILGQSFLHERLNRLVGHPTRFVVWGGELPGQRYCSVGTDNVRGGKRATAHLARLGRKRIAFFGDTEAPEIGQRYDGYRIALEEAGLPLDPALVSPAHFKIESAEALLRWDRGNPEGIEPNEFIPLIESTELIHSIGAWVINEACRACKEWHDTGARLRVAVNVSALQLTRAGFYEVVVDALERHDLPPDTLEIEITEHSLLKEMPLVKSQLAALKELGVSLVIDDFGTGYSNMGYLTRLQIDTLKLDRSFIAQISQSEEHRVIVTAIIKMANVLGMTVVAEGIETNDDRDILLGLNCDFGQGYLWSPAIPSHALIKLVSDL